MSNGIFLTQIDLAAKLYLCFSLTNNFLLLEKQMPIILVKHFSCVDSINQRHFCSCLNKYQNIIVCMCNYSELHHISKVLSKP